MVSKFTALILILFSFILAYGVYDPIFGIHPNFGLSEILAILLILTSFIFNYKSLIKKFDINIVYLFLILFFLFFSSTMYEYSSYNKPDFNLKLLICILMYYSLINLYNKKTAYMHYSLLAYSIGVFVLIMLLNTVLINEVTVSNGRLMVFGENPNSTSARFSIAAIYFFYLAIYNPFRITLLRYMAIPMSLPILYIIMQSGSRGSFISTAISLLILIYFSKIKKLYKSLITLILIFSLPILANIISNAGSIYDRLVESFVHQDSAGRNYIWAASLEIIANNLLLGVGEAGYFHEVQQITGHYVDTHNLALYLLATGGIVVFSLFLLFYKNIFSNALFYFKRNDVLPMVLLLNITLVSLKTGGALTYLIMWVVFAIIAAYSMEKEDCINPQKNSSVH